MTFIFFIVTCVIKNVNNFCTPLLDNTIQFFMKSSGFAQILFLQFLCMRSVDAHFFKNMKSIVCVEKGSCEPISVTIE